MKQIKKTLRNERLKTHVGLLKTHLDKGLRPKSKYRGEHLRLITGMLVILILFALSISLGYLIWRRVFADGIVLAVVSGVTGSFFIFAAASIAGLFRNRRGSMGDFMSMHVKMLDAIDQIAHGNFNVLISSQRGDPHYDITNAINEMSKNLGSLENMRQDFISNVSHEFQSPLTSIGGFAALLKNPDLPLSDRLRYAEVIADETKRLSSLSDNLLKLSALDEKKPLSLKAFSLDKQLQRVALICELSWSKKNISLEVDLPKCNIVGDEDLLAQVWTNLLHNAIKFTPKGGGIKITLAEKADGVEVAVADTGIGIAADSLIHIFERCYKADKSRDRALGGNGLGLALVKRIAELHGGSVAAESEIGGGATFTVTLPKKIIEPSPQP
jgi:signal transduction histidine kinase